MSRSGTRGQRASDSGTPADPLMTDRRPTSKALKNFDEPFPLAAEAPARAPYDDYLAVPVFVNAQALYLGF
jgi:hypothetical protein